MRDAKRAGEFIQPLEIRRIRHRDVQTFFVALQRQKLMTHHQIDRNLIEECVVDRRFLIGGQQIRRTAADNDAPVPSPRAPRVARGPVLGRSLVLDRGVRNYGSLRGESGCIRFSILLHVEYSEQSSFRLLSDDR